MAFELDENTPDNLREYVKRLEEKAGAADKVGDLERQLAMVKAGIDPENPKQKYFAAGYDGDLTPDAIKAAAVEAGLVDANPAPPEQGAAERIAGAEGAGSSDPVPDHRASKEAFINEMKKVHGEGGNEALTSFLDKNGIGVSTIQ